MAKELEKTKAGGGLATLSNKVAADAGKGVSRAAYDNIVPLVYVLQPLSPQVNKRNPAYIEGAEPGSIWLRDAPLPIVSGDEGFEFQPCYFWRDVVEWVPRDRGGGFVARHLPQHELEEMDAIAKRLGAKEVRDVDNPNRVDFVMPNGNELIETRYHAGYVHVGKNVLPFVVPLSGTGHTVSRRFMFMIGNQRMPDGTPLPSWAGVYNLRTIEKSNSSGTWFQLEPSFVRLVDGLQEAIDADDGSWEPGRGWTLGAQLYEAFESGAKQAEAPAEPSAASADVI